jgi:hypothetical protein
VKLNKGKPYWVYIQSEKNSWEGWNDSNSATGGFVEGTNDTRQLFKRSTCRRTDNSVTCRLHWLFLATIRQQSSPKNLAP